MPKMLMVSIAASGALAGAALVQFAHCREVLAGFAQAATQRARSGFTRAWDALARRRTGIAAHSSSGNAGFDAYRAEAIRSLEEEHKAFEAFVTRLRDAEDREAFQAFLATKRAALATQTKGE